jgi:hypothetical protein
MADSKPKKQPVHRISLSLSPNSAEAVGRIRQNKGLNETDAIRKAISFYDWFLTEEAKGSKLKIVHPDGSENGLIIVH